MFSPSFWLEFVLNFSKFRIFFSSKMGPICFFSPLVLNLLEGETLKLRPDSS